MLLEHSGTKIEVNNTGYDVCHMSVISATQEA